MDFVHVRLAVAAASDSIELLSLAAPIAGSTVDPVAQLYRLDCSPAQIVEYAKQMRTASERLESAKAKIDAAEKKLRKWKGEAGEAARAKAGKLAWACEQAKGRAANQSYEGYRIADKLDELATDGAARGEAIAGSVEGECALLISGQDLPEEEERQAKERVYAACQELKAMVDSKVPEQASVGNGLNDLRKPR